MNDVYLELSLLGSYTLFPILEGLITYCFAICLFLVVVIFFPVEHDCLFKDI